LPKITINPQKNNPKRLAQSQISIVTKGKIKDRILKMLNEIEPEDKLRIQMFYLSDLDVVKAIINAAKVTTAPIQIILDPNKDAFAKIKDGTPNRQVATHLLAKKQEMNLNLDIRWYETHGEQNHTKIMTITSPTKQELITGSANWTGKNIANINMKSNIHIKGNTALTKKLQQSIRFILEQF